jgi:hypothetical protein
MITIVTYFRSQVVKFIFAGRNSGQNAEGKRDDACLLRSPDEPVMCNCPDLILRLWGNGRGCKIASPTSVGPQTARSRHVISMDRTSRAHLTGADTFADVMLGCC